jgi:hypothetical protein
MVIGRRWSAGGGPGSEGGYDFIAAGRDRRGMLPVGCWPLSYRLPVAGTGAYHTRTERRLHGGPG